MCFFAKMDTPAKRLRFLRERAKIETATDAARRYGWTVPTYLGHENGDRNPSRAAAKRYAAAYKARWEWILEGGETPNGDEPEPRPVVPLIGFVGAGWEAHFYGDSQGPFEEVPGFTGANADTVAVQINGESLGAFFDRWLVFYDDVRSPVTPDLINELCVVGLPDGRVLIKKLRQAGGGLYHLISATEDPILDVAVDWAAKVRRMEPRP